MQTAETSVEEELPGMRELLWAHGDSVARVLRYSGVPEADLPDAVQEVFLVAHRRADSFVGGDAGKWLRTIAFHHARNARRARQRRRETPAADSATLGVAPAEQPGAVERSELRDRLKALLAKLSPEHRAVVVLYEIEQLPMREVAEQLQIPLQTDRALGVAAKNGLDGPGAPSVPRPPAPPEPRQLRLGVLPILGAGLRLRRARFGMGLHSDGPEAASCVVEPEGVRCAPLVGEPVEPAISCETHDGPLELEEVLDDGERVTLRLHRGSARFEGSLPSRRRYGTDAVDCVDGALVWTQLTHVIANRDREETGYAYWARLDQLVCDPSGCDSSSVEVPVGGTGGSTDVRRVGAETMLAQIPNPGEIRVRRAPFAELGEASDVSLTYRRLQLPGPSRGSSGPTHVALVSDGSSVAVLTDYDLVHMVGLRIAADGSFEPLRPAP